LSLECYWQYRREGKERQWRRWGPAGREKGGGLM